MCVAIIKKSGVDLPSEEILKICFKNNPHGAGFALFRNNLIYIHKGFFTFDGFMKEIKNVSPTKEETMLIHFRVATHGKINIENCHPFPIVNRFFEMANPIKVFSDTDVMVHNGKLSIEITSGSYSDSMHFARALFGLDRTKFSDIINMAIHPTELNPKGNRIAVLTRDGNIEQYGVGWLEDGGIVYSNDSYKEVSTYKGHKPTTTTKTTPATSATTTFAYQTVVVKGKTTTVRTEVNQKNKTNTGFDQIDVCDHCGLVSNSDKSKTDNSNLTTVFIPSFGNVKLYNTRSYCEKCYEHLFCNQCTGCKKHFFSTSLVFFKDGRTLCNDCEKIQSFVPMAT